MVFILKWILVLGLLAAGCFFLMEGLGVQVPLIKYEGWEGRDIPAGVILLAAGILLTCYWKVSVTEQTVKTTTNSKEGITTTTTSTVTTYSMQTPANLDHNQRL